MTEQQKPQLLWHSNAPHSPTGYGSQTALFVKRLKEYFRVGVSAFYGVEANIIPWNGVPVYPALAQTHGNETIKQHAGIHFGDDLRAGLTVTLMDVWVLDPIVWRDLNTVSWVPVDHEPTPDPVVDFLREGLVVPLAMSKFGEQMLRDDGLDPLYCPHAIDTSVYAPRDKAFARDLIGLPEDAFVVGMVAANKGNPSRKCFYEVLEAFRELRAGHEEAVLYLHTLGKAPWEAVDVPTLVKKLGIPPDAVMFPDQYRMLHYPYSAEHLAHVYSALDVLAAPSMGEGFGIPTVEAQACGTPVIVSDFSAQPELVGAGWIVDGRKSMTAIGSWQFLPDIADVYQAMVGAYTWSARDRENAAEKARSLALEYDIEKVMDEHMLPALDAAQLRFNDRKPVTVPAKKKAAKPKAGKKKAKKAAAK